MAEAHGQHDHAGHDHGPGHHHGPADYGRAFAIGVTLNLAYVATEAIVGLRAPSVALLADAAHNLSDVLGLLVAWAGAVLAKRLPSAKFTYGLRSSSILAALANAAFLLLVTGGIAWEAVQRFLEPGPVASGTIIAVAAVGVVINLATALLFMSGRKSDLNIRGAYLHMAADAAVSLGVVIAGIGIYFTDWLWLDPAMSLTIAVVIVVSTWGLLGDSVRLALAGVPEEIEVERVRGFLAKLPGVSAVHDLHIWGMSTTETALTAHLVMPAGHPGDEFLSNAYSQLHGDFNIGHATLQIEIDPDRACALAPDHVV